MSQQILGLLTSAKFQALSDRFNEHRRQILHVYPNGGAPLTGLLSMFGTESLPDTVYTWYEKRYVSPKTLTRGTNPITKTAPSTGDADDGTIADTGATAVTVPLYIKVATTVDLRPGLTIQVEGGTGKNLQFWITAVTRGASSEALLGYVTVLPLRAFTFAAGDAHAVSTTNAVAPVRVIGSANNEGGRGGGVISMPFKRPINLQNTTQIFRTAMSFSGTVLKEGLKYDKTGPYKEKFRDTVVDHMTQIERALIWGQRSTTLRADLDGAGGETTAVRTFSGIVEFLNLWDAGSTGLSIDGSTYAPFSHKSASTLDSDHEKRVLANADGGISVKRFNTWAERLSRYHSNKTRDKMVLCGSQALLAFAELFRRNSSLQVSVGDKAYGLDFTTFHTAFGNYHFMTHPLFNEDPNTLGKWALFLDPNTFKLRPLLDRDTRLLKNRQNPGDDFRKDEFLTELGLESHVVESNMLIKNITHYVEE